MSVDICNGSFDIEVSTVEPFDISVQSITNSVRVVTPVAFSISATSSQGPKGAKGEDGEAGLPAVNKINRHAYIASYSYCGTATYNSGETQPTELDTVWTIKRIYVDNDGTTTITQATDVNWTDYLTHTYS